MPAVLGTCVHVPSASSRACSSQRRRTTSAVAILVMLAICSCADTLWPSRGMPVPASATSHARQLTSGGAGTSSNATATGPGPGVSTVALALLRARSRRAKSRAAALAPAQNDSSDTRCHSVVNTIVRQSSVYVLVLNGFVTYRCRSENPRTVCRFHHSLGSGPWWHPFAMAIVLEVCTITCTLVIYWPKHRHACTDVARIKTGTVCPNVTRQIVKKSNYKAVSRDFYTKLLGLVV